MAVHLILLGLLSLCSLSFSQECNQALQVNVDFPGTDIAFQYSPDVQHCQLLCTQHPSCLFFTFVRADWTRDGRHFYCYLKSTPTGRPNVQTPLVGVTSGYSLKPCSQGQVKEPCLSEVYHDVDFPGADYRFLFTADYEECQRVCTQDPSCEFFTFANGSFSVETIRHKCHLKFSWTIPRTPIVERTAGVTSGFSHNAQMTTQIYDAVCQSKLFPDTDIAGQNVLVERAASPEQCQALCSAHPTCTYFTFVRSTFSCNLKKNPDKMVTTARNGYTSGLPTHFCQPDNNWLKVAHEGVDFRGSDIRFELMDNAEECQRTCTDDPNCQFYTYVTKNFRDRNFWRRCYVKRVITVPSLPKVTKLNNVVSGFTLKKCLLIPKSHV
ncbi:coagulation factor XI-like [Stegastes partitus]|uniref:Coagulation factor XI-like n=1 Tax=Stegastes partitus TaxID=144197 RepID=A0A3B5B6X3_9TELE|nr:PREDICTED: coagulation factor XI-like [Stegastes partitus]